MESSSPINYSNRSSGSIDSESTCSRDSLSSALSPFKIFTQPLLTKNQDFFNKSRNMMNIARIFDFFNLDDNLKLSKLNSRIFNYVKKIKNSSSLIEIKKRFLFAPILNLNSIEEVVKKLVKEKNSQSEIFYEFFATYIFKYIFCRIIHIHQHSDDTILNLVKYFKNFSHKYEVGVLQFEDNNLKPSTLDFILSSFLIFNPVNNLIKITITNSHLNDDNLQGLKIYLEKNKSLKTLVLNSNEIGMSEKALDFLRSFKKNCDIEWLSFDLCYFSTPAIEILKEIYLSHENRIKSLTMYYNLFSLTSVEKLFDINFYNASRQEKFSERIFSQPLTPPEERKFLGISYKYSPDYNLNNFSREVSFDRNFFLSRYDDTEFFDIYLAGLNFETLSLKKIDSNIIYVIEKIFDNNYFLNGINADLNSLCDWSCRLLLKLITKDKLIRISLAEEKNLENRAGQLNSSSMNNYFNNRINLPSESLTPQFSKFKIIEFLNVIKELKNLKFLKLYKINLPDLGRYLIETIESLETLKVSSLNMLGIYECKTISEEELVLISSLCQNLSKISKGGLKFENFSKGKILIDFKNCQNEDL
jgi:hypothetical protein